MVVSKNKINLINYVVVLAILVLVYTLFESVSTYSSSGSDFAGVEKFSSEQELRNYLQESAEFVSFGYLSPSEIPTNVRTLAISPDISYEKSAHGETAEPKRVSETNVQVLGIDEPDIVKTNGKEIYFSPGSWGYKGYWGYYEDARKTKIINAFPPEDLENLAEIDKTGELLLHKNILVVFSEDKIYGYDISSPQNPDKKWVIELNSSFVSARLYDGKIYLITKNWINRYSSYPIMPLTYKGNPISVEYYKIYHPVNKIPVDVIYHGFSIDPISGEIKNSISFIGTSSGSVVYMSNNAVYVTYFYYKDVIELIYNFLNEKCKDLVPLNVIEDINRLRNYELSDQAKMVEIKIIFERYMSSLDKEEQRKLENEFLNRMKDYMKEHVRELEKTGIIKINLDLEVEASAEIPGKPLNQFSLDEFDNHLRVATTLGNSLGQNANDLYILDGNLKIVGKIKDYGLQERIYSVRFVGDKGYIVTFKQIDPFFVIDLSDPKNPEIKGKLKIPGYSSYLHPIEEDKILGIGKEESKVKISLFDVSSPENPKEISKYFLQEYWSDILNTHHAFLLDKKHKIFFLPGRSDGYVFSYEDYEIKLEKVIVNTNARRAIYLDDYLYIIGDNKIIVLDENTWEKVNELEF